MLPDWEHLSAERKLTILEPVRLDGGSAQDMADLFQNATRHSIIGLLTRQKIPLLGKPANSWGSDKERERRTLERQRQQTKSRAARDRNVVPGRPEPVRINTIIDDTPMARRKTLLQLNDKVCRWPVGDPLLDEDFHFCGAPTSEGVYCRKHGLRAGYVVRGD